MDASWTVTAISNYIREMFDLDLELQDVTVVGEISNVTQARSGHLYFTLKDANAQLKCVMWRTEAAWLPFVPEPGKAASVHGRISVYPAGGAYQLYADQMAPTGIGDLYQQFEALKEKLGAAGLFDPARKKPLPFFPRRIGIATSPDAAALHDIIHVLSRRFPLVEILLAPTLVQGEQAPSEIVRALAALDSRDDIDVIILTRGGGSMEDLWAFNDERVAYAIFGCRHPVISGIGHETDYTIADLTADVRAPTPSAAAEIATPDVSELAVTLEAIGRRLESAQRTRLETARWRLGAIARTLGTLSPQQRLRNLAQRLDELEGRSDRAMIGRIQSASQRLKGLDRALAGLNPLATLARGYAIVRCSDSGIVIKDSIQVKAGDRLNVQVHAGSFDVNVLE